MELDRASLIEVLKAMPRFERIAHLRSLYRLSQAGLANIAGVARTTVSTWEAPIHWTQGGKGHEPAKMPRQRMAQYFGLPAYVFTDDWGNNPLPRNRGGRKTHPQAPVIRVPPTGVTSPPPGVKRIG